MIDWLVRLAGGEDDLGLSADRVPATRGLTPVLVTIPEKRCLLYCMLRRDIVEFSRCNGAGLDDDCQEVAS